jgi:hypothetical protein
VASTFTSCTFNAAVTNLTGDSSYTDSTFAIEGVVTNTAGHANYTDATFISTSTFINSGVGDPVLSTTSDVALELTTPAADINNTITDDGSKNVIVNVVNGTTSVVITGTKLEGQTVVIGGTDIGNVTVENTSATTPIYTVDTEADGSKVFTLTVSEIGKSDIVYTVTVVVAGP